MARGALLALVATAAILAGCSTPPVLSTPPLPTGWKTVDYHGVGVDVPGTWTVEPWRANCGVSTPTVYIGPEGESYLNCPLYTPGGAEVVLGSLPFTGTSAPAQPGNINGLPSLVVSDREHVECGPGNGVMFRDWVTLPTKGLSISVWVAESTTCPGGAPGRTDQIVQTIHVVS